MDGRWSVGVIQGGRGRDLSSSGTAQLVTMLGERIKWWVSLRNCRQLARLLGQRYSQKLVRSIFTTPLKLIGSAVYVGSNKVKDRAVWQTLEVRLKTCSRINLLDFLISWTRLVGINNSDINTHERITAFSLSLLHFRVSVRAFKYAEYITSKCAWEE